mmetsp:Transcript_15136/g.29058  ORF Transcript_15136/g.29058 Transcript_15136/m.29058 type:complete len:257 (-) Transcript_15136:1247-2017(-)
MSSTRTHCLRSLSVSGASASPAAPSAEGCEVEARPARAHASSPPCPLGKSWLSGAHSSCSLVSCRCSSSASSSYLTRWHPSATLYQSTCPQYQSSAGQRTLTARPRQLASRGRPSQLSLGAHGDGKVANELPPASLMATLGFWLAGSGSLESTTLPSCARACFGFFTGSSAGGALLFPPGPFLCFRPGDEAGGTGARPLSAAAAAEVCGFSWTFELFAVGALPFPVETGGLGLCPALALILRGFLMLTRFALGVTI